MHDIIMLISTCMVFNVHPLKLQSGLLHAEIMSTITSTLEEKRNIFKLLVGDLAIILRWSQWRVYLYIQSHI